MTILHEKVANTVTLNNLEVEEIACDPDFADTAVFSEKYGFTIEQGANTIIVASRKIEPTRYAVCVVLASTRLDVNKAVTKLMEVKKASFADAEVTRQLSEMEIGGVTAVGIDNIPIYVDGAVFGQLKVVMGGGNRSSKILLNPNELLKLSNVRRVEGLAKPVV
ncbi:MAG: YbaK/EbsC family protein [Candidatus Saccharimonadales bacterium]